MLNFWVIRRGTGWVHWAGLVSLVVGVALVQPGFAQNPAAKRTKAAATEEAEAAPAKRAAAPAAAAEPAKKYKELPCGPDSAERKKQRQRVFQILKARKFEAGEQQVLEQYYKEYAFPRWTLPQNYGLVSSDFRKELRTELSGGKSGPPYEALVQLTFDTMSKWANDKELHPAVRCNAMLTVAELNAQEAEAGVRAATAPLPAALPVMVAALKSADQLDAVRVAALIGLTRHCAASTAPGGTAMTGNAMRQVTTTLLAVATAHDAPAGRSAEGHAWMRALAIEALGDLRELGTGNEVATTLLGLVGDKTNPMLVRSAAARALGMLRFPGAAGLKAVDFAKPLGELAVDACVAEAKRKPVTSLAAGPAGMMGPGGSSMMGPGYMASPTPRGGYPGGMPGGMPGMGMPGMGEGAEEVADEAATAFRRRLKTLLNAVRVGLSGIEPYKPGTPAKSGVLSLAAGTKDEEMIEKVYLRQVNLLMGELDNETDQHAKLLAKVKKSRGRLETALKDPTAALTEVKQEEAAKGRKTPLAPTATPPAAGTEAAPAP